MEHDGSDEKWNFNTCYGYYCMLLNDIPHVWHRIDANLEWNKDNKLVIQKLKDTR